MAVRLVTSGRASGSAEANAVYMGMATTLKNPVCRVKRRDRSMSQGKVEGVCADGHQLEEPSLQGQMSKAIAG